MTQMAQWCDNDPAVLAAVTMAREMFDRWCALAVPPSESAIDLMQLELMKWQNVNFGPQPDAMMALGMIEEMGETFDANTPDKTEEALDGLGDVCVYASQLATNNRLAIGPILDLARAFTCRSGLIPLRAAPILAQVVLKGAQKIRGLADVGTYRTRLVGAMAMCIAKAIDDVEMLHDITVSAGGVFVQVGGEVLQRGAGHPGIPQEVPIVPKRPDTDTYMDTIDAAATLKEQRKTDALARLETAADEVLADRLTNPPEPEP